MLHESIVHQRTSVCQEGREPPFLPRLKPWASWRELCETLKLFLDLDGTLNRMHDKWLLAIQTELGERLILKDITSWERLGDKRYQDLFQTPGFFANLGVETGAQQALQMAQAKGHELFILGAAGPWNYADKHHWIERHFPYIHYRNIIFATCKGEVAGPGRVLIDDGVHNLAPWAAAGGIAAAYSQPWNTTWTGHRLNKWHELADLLHRMEETPCQGIA